MGMNCGCIFMLMRSILISWEVIFKLNFVFCVANETYDWPSPKSFETLETPQCKTILIVHFEHKNIQVPLFTHYINLTPYLFTSPTR
jgi:hypothetical protein